MASPSADLRAALTGSDTPEPPRSRFVWWAVAAWVVFALAATMWAASHVEGDIRADVDEALAEFGIESTVSGRDVTVSGGEGAAVVAGLTGVRTVTVDTPPPPVAAPPVVEPPPTITTTVPLNPAVPHVVAGVRDGVLTLEGTLASDTLAAITPIAELIYAPNLVIDVEVTEDAEPAPWEPAVAALIAVLPITGDAQVLVRDGEAVLAATAIDERRRAQLVGAVTAVLGDGFDLDTDIRVSDLRAPSFAAVASPDGTIVLSGEMPDDEIAATIAAFAADAYGADNVTNEMTASGDVARTFSPFRIPFIFHSLRAIPEWNIAIDDDAISGNLRGGATFGVASARLTPELETLLDIAAGILLRNPTVGAVIEGHTDSRGAAADNQRLSEDRAMAAAAYLAALGIAPERLTAIGFGETRPIAENSTPEGRAQNRRIEFVLAPVQQ